MLLRLVDIDPAARRLEVLGPWCGRYLIAQTRRRPCQPRTRWCPGIPARPGTSGRTGGAGPVGGTGWGGARAGLTGGAGASGRPRVAGRERAGRAVWARAAVGGLPVLIVGGDRPYAYPLGLAEQDPEPRSFGSRATRIACPCDQPPPCLHGQALYAQVVSVAVPPPPGGHAAAVALRRSAC